MALLSKVVWSEGMHLAPHHFQAQSRYFEDSVQFVTDNLWDVPYGFTSLRLDPEAIRNGTVALLHARGLFQDGLSFDMPECDQLPRVQSVTGIFPPAAEGLTIYLAVPTRALDGPNFAAEPDLQSVNTRFIGETQTISDENTGRDQKLVQLGRKNIRLVLETEIKDELTTLPLTRIVRDTSGRFAFDATFVPPCIKIRASDRLMELLQRLIGILEERSSAVSRMQHPVAGRFQPGMSSGQVAQFWFLHCVNSSLAPLRHLLLTKHGHPEELYREMLRLGGGLCTFGLDTHPRTLPVYNHESLGASFRTLDEHIRRLLEVVMPSQAIPIPLKTNRDLHNGDVKDDRCFGPSRWILGIHAEMGEADLIRKAAKLVKVCSAKFVPELINRALPGLVLTHLQVPPPAIAGRVENQYFSIEKAGPCWEHIQLTKQIGVYVPDEIPHPELELTVVLDN